GTVSVSCSSDGVCKDDAPAAPVTTIAPDLPSAADAERKARELFDAVGDDVEGLDATVENYGAGVSVQFEQRVGDLEAIGWSRGATFGEKGALQNAFGSLADTVKVGDYPLVEPKKAFERSQALQEQSQVRTLEDRAAQEGGAVDSEAAKEAELRAGASGGSSGSGSSGSSGSSAGSTGVAEPAPAPDQPVSDGGAGGTDPAPGSEPVPRPLPADQVPIPEPEPVVVKLTDVEIVLVVEHPMCPGGTVYVVPAYRFTSEDGEEHVYGPVPAVGDEYLASASKGGDEPVSSEGCAEPGAVDLPAKEEPGVGATEPAVRPDSPPPPDVAPETIAPNTTTG
ncbi:MAG TPA: hypothetical protein VF230_08455, partial [Acidimicrobiales bacterium]